MKAYGQSRVSFVALKRLTILPLRSEARSKSHAHGGTPLLDNLANHLTGTERGGLRW